MIHPIQNGCLRVEVAEHGAELQSIRDADGTEYLWQGDGTYWSDRAPNLFPYVARLTEGKYRLDGREYHMDIHGLAPYMDFTLKDRSETWLALELRSNQATRGAYPREFIFRVIYALAGSALYITYEVENRDERTMYFGLGAHPGFRVPVRAGERFEDYRLRFAPQCRPRRIGFTPDCFLDGTDQPFPLDGDGCLPLRHGLFDQDAIVLKDAGHEVCLERADGERVVTVRFPGMNYLGLWHRPKTDAPYLCIEPWCSLPSTAGKIAVLEEQPDLLRLTPGQLYRNTWQILPGSAESRWA